MTTLVQDLRYALRTLLKNPGFTTAAVATLVLAIGANTTIFSVVNAVLLRPLPLLQQNRLVVLRETSPELPRMMVSYPDYVDWRRQNRVFSEMAVYNRFRSMNLSGRGDPERISANAVSASYLVTLGVAPSLGRGFLPEDDKPGAAPTAVLLHGFYERLGGDRSLLGSTLTLDGQPFLVIGVMPRSFQFPSRTTSLLVPLRVVSGSELEQRDSHPGLIGLARLRPDVSLERARLEMDTIARRIAAQYPASNAGEGVEVRGLSEALSSEIRPVLVLLLIAVGFVLLIGCSNVASLVLARGLARRREVAIRVALGASGGRIVRALLMESLLLALPAGALAVGVVELGSSVLRQAAASAVPRASEIGIDTRVLAFTLVLSLATGFLSGLLPALRVLRGSLESGLRESARGAAGSPGKTRLRFALVVGEVALSLLLLAGAALMIKSLRALGDVDPGFSSRGVLVASISLSSSSLGATSPRTFYERTLERLRSVPGVRFAAAIDPLPFGNGGWQEGITIEGLPDPGPNRNPSVDASVVTPEYFDAMRIPVLQGRSFDSGDDARAPLRGVVSRAAARRFWPNGNAVGGRIKLGNFSSPDPWIEIVGVVGDVRRVSLQRDPGSEIYLSFLQKPHREASIVVLTAGDPSLFAPLVLSAVRSVDPNQPVYGVAPLGRLLDESLDERRFATTLLAGFAGLALVLALVGIYGLMAHFVTMRRREIGIRIALGATPSQILRLVVGQGMRPVLLGVVAGLAGAFAITGAFRRFLFAVSPSDPAVLAFVCLLVAVVALLANGLPATRAAKTDPIAALRQE